jgi:MFS family permease
MINRRFASYWAGQTISQFGDRISELALPLIAVVTLAATPTQVGVTTAAVWAPNLLCLLVGSWADRRTHRKRILVAADVLRALVLLSLIAAVCGALCCLWLLWSPTPRVRSLADLDDQVALAA